MRAAEADSVQVHGRRGKDATMTDAPLFPAPQSTRFRIQGAGSERDRGRSRRTEVLVSNTGF